MITREDLENGRDAKYWKDRAITAEDELELALDLAEAAIKELENDLEEAKRALNVTGVKQKDTAVFPPDAWGQQRTVYDTTTDVD